MIRARCIHSSTSCSSAFSERWFPSLCIIPWFFIFKKAGFSPLLALLMFVPLVNIIMLYFLAFARWNVVPVGMVYPTPPVPYRPPV